GDYLGRNHGKILVIDDSKIDVMEIVPDGEGGWPGPGVSRRS
ncbi:MAG: hypothetical protein E2599_04395, partial [Klebsiella sp.]|nr:hypothetical protein [Klebsiella sp.]